jgi:hypothetical protein
LEGKGKQHIGREGMKTIILLTALILISGCISKGPVDSAEEQVIESLTAEQKFELAKQILTARLQDGWDSVEWTIGGFEVFSRKRERDVNGGQSSPQ